MRNTVSLGYKQVYKAVVRNHIRYENEIRGLGAVWISCTATQGLDVRYTIKHTPVSQNQDQSCHIKSSCSSRITLFNGGCEYL